MIDQTGRVDRDAPQTVLNEEGPWGQGDERAPGKAGKRPEGSRNPWLQAPRRGPRKPKGDGQPSLEELIRRGRDRFGGLPGGGRPIWGYALIAFVALWLVSTSIHRIDPQDRGVVTRFGRYVDTLGPGLAFTLPAPIDVVTRVDVDDRRSFDVPVSGGPNLLVTQDQALADVGYTVNWSVRDPGLYLFGMAGTPEDAIRDAAQGAMREAVAGMRLDRVTAPGQGDLGARVAARLQQMLDRDRVGVQVQGVTIRRADLPSQLADSAKDIAAARGEVQKALAEARTAAADDVGAAQAQAQAFDKVYDAYRLSPQVTRSRMYYETMEAILAKSDKTIVDVPSATVMLPPPPPRKAEQGGGQ